MFILKKNSDIRGALFTIGVIQWYYKNVFLKIFGRIITARDNIFIFLYP